MNPNDPIHLRLTNIANKLQMLWGRTPDADTLFEAAGMLAPAPPKETKATPKKAPKSKGPTNA